MIDTLKPLVKQFMPFAQKRLGFSKPPRMFLKQDEENAKNPLGRTAYYDPEQMSITLYTTGRHPKDVMRSLAHELVHHTQNCNGMFDNVGSVGEGYAQNDEHLREMEREAYEQGNLCFRDWEDSIKNTIYFEHLQKGDNVMSTKKWKNKELNGLLTEGWGFKMDLSKLNEKQFANDDDLDGDKDGKPKWADPDDPANDKKEEQNESQEIFAPNHYCVHHGGVEHNGKMEMAEAVSHNYNKRLGRVTHYNMKLADGTILENVAFEDIQVTNASLAEGHGGHPAKRDDEDKEELDEMCGDPAPMHMEPDGDEMYAQEMAPEQILMQIQNLLSQLQGSMAMQDDAMMERRGRGRDREGMEPDERRRPMNEAVVRERIRKLLKNVKFKK